MIDTHTHLDGEEFREDLPEVISRAREAGITQVFVPAIDLKSCDTVLSLCRQYPDYARPMLGLHPEEVRSDWREVLSKIKEKLIRSKEQGAGSKRIDKRSKKSILLPPAPCSQLPAPSCSLPLAPCPPSILAIGEVGLDYYWSREYEREQIEAFEEQVRWSVEMRLPLMIHCRKAQNEMVHLLRHYKDDLPGGVFHCFTGNEREALELLQFDRFVLGIGGVLTFKKSHLPEVLPQVVPLSRIVLETDSPYMAPVPHRGKRNESAYVVEVARRLAEAYGVSLEEISSVTDANVRRVFSV